MGNIITFNNLYKKIVDADAAGDYALEALLYGKIAYLITNFTPVDASPRILSAELPDSSFRENINELFTAAGVSDEVQMYVNNVEEFLSGLVSVAVTSMAENSDECERNSTILRQTFANLRTQVSNENYTAAAASLQ